MTIDWQAVVNEAYPPELDRPGDEIEQVIGAVQRAWDRWGEHDFREGRTLRGLEERIESDIEAFGARKQVIVIDQWWLKLNHEKPQGLYVIDWKLRTKSLNDAWIDRLKRSDQGLWYIHGLAAARELPLTPDTEITMEFRGVAQRAPTLVSIKQSFAGADIFAFDQQRSWWERRFAADHKEGYERPWGRDLSGCRKYGPLYPCRFERFCPPVGKEPAPAAPPDFPIVANASFSSTQEYKRCPERARLLTIEKNCGMIVDVEDGESAEAGKAFHRGISSCYGQYRKGMNK